MELRTRFGLTALGINRGDGPLSGGLLAERLKTGDTLLVIGPWKEIERYRGDNKDLVVIRLPVEARRTACRARQDPLQAVVCLVFVIGLMVSGVVPNVQAALIGCLLMGLFGCVDFASAYRAIDWKTIVLIVGMLPFSIALESTGGVALAAEGLKTTDGGHRNERCAGDALRGHCNSGNVHLQHGHGGPDGARGAGCRPRTWACRPIPSR